MGNKKHADEDNTHLYLSKMKVMHDKQCLLSCINLRRPGRMDSTVQLIILMGEKVQLTLLLNAYKSVQCTAPTEVTIKHIQLSVNCYSEQRGDVSLDVRAKRLDWKYSVKKKFFIL